MAARTAAEAGADVIVIDENTEIGGRLLSETEEVGGKPGDVWAGEMREKTRRDGQRPDHDPDHGHRRL